MFRQTKSIASLALLVSSLLALHATTALAADDQSHSAVDVAVEFSSPSANAGPATGRLMGMLMDGGGQPVVGKSISLKQLPLVEGTTPRQTKTDAEGKFAFELGRGGAYLVEGAGDVKLCRVWHRHQAPPVAIQRVLLTSANTTVRGQDFVSYQGAYDAGCGGGMSTGVEGGFQNCDSDCGQPPRLSNCDDSSLFGGGLFGGGCGSGCGCDSCGGGRGGGGCGFLSGGGRSKLLLGLLGGAVIGYALDDDDGPIEAEVPAS